jgi:hypothetical protein
MKFSSLLPFEKYVLVTTLTPEEVLRRLGNAIQAENDYTWSAFRRVYRKPYRGAVTGLTFRMIRNINYRNSFIPVIRGRVTSISGQTEIMINMRPVGFIIVFMSFWLGLTGLVCIGILLNGIFQFREILQNGFSLAFIIPFIMFAFGSGLFLYGFKSESNQSKEFLADLLKADHPD